ncbi:MAG: mechanosensitive ion channel [Salinivirgaceae bacterium]|jgi:miniconductance mechanosensitive channel|nr:mechanosensitive ion channel [Salinivirgaceae bacterium]
MDKYIEALQNWLVNMGLSTGTADNINTITIVIVILLLSFIADIIAKHIIIRVISGLVKHSKNKWDDIIHKRKVFNRLAHFAPALVIHWSVDFALKENPELAKFIQNTIYIYMTVIGTIVINLFFKALNEIYLYSPISKNRPIKGYVQLVNIFVFFIAVILIISFLTGSSPGKLLAGLGALAAVLMLVFKDTILGLVASVQLSANNMVKIGDWISMPSQKADGTVLEITLNTVKVQNWDKTISTIPTYALVNETFSNWRGMEESGGRRIKRSINIDMTSVKFCSAEMINKFRKIRFLENYINKKTQELENFNTENNIDNSVLVNGRRMTNIGTFRKYVEEYLHNQPKIHQEMTFLVRQLQPTEKGVPIEIYVFSTDQAWANYEAIQADIFDHIMAIIPEFDLKVFQYPTTYSFEKLVR